MRQYAVLWTLFPALFVQIKNHQTFIEHLAKTFVPDKIGYCRSSVVCYFFISLRETTISQIFNGVIFGRSCRGANVFILSKMGSRNWSLVRNKRWLLLRGSKVVVANGGARFGLSGEVSRFSGEVVNRSCIHFTDICYDNATF